MIRTHLDAALELAVKANENLLAYTIDMAMRELVGMSTAGPGTPSEELAASGGEPAGSGMRPVLQTVGDATETDSVRSIRIAQANPTSPVSGVLSDLPATGAARRSRPSRRRWPFL